MLTEPQGNDLRPSDSRRRAGCPAGLGSAELDACAELHFNGDVRKSVRDNDGGKRLPHQRDAYDWITLATAVFGAIVVAASSLFAAWNAFLVRDQIAIMQSQQRPWVAVDLEAERNGLTHDGAARAFEFKTKLKNEGQMVATDVRMDFMQLFGNEDTDHTLEARIESAQENACDEADRRKRRESLFPGQSSETHWTLTDNSAQSGDIYPVIAGCVKYSFANSKTVHHTPFAFRYSRTAVETAHFPGRIVTTTTTGQPFVSGEDVPPSRITFDRSFFGNKGPD